MSEETLRALTKKRAAVKGKLTIFENYVKTIEGLDPSESDRAKVIELEQRIGNAEKIITNYDETQSQIECEAETPEEHFGDREAFESKFFIVMAKAKSLLEKLNIQPDNDDVTSRSSSQSVQLEGVKLPEIRLPKFDGQYENWMEFRDIFESLIHQNAQINNIQKYHYLRASLVGSASQVIQSLEFSGDNYNIAWNILCERFDNKRLLIHNHIQAIFSLESITRESAAKIRNLNDNVSKHLNILNQLGEPTDSWDTLIIFILASKLDVNAAREWEKYKARRDSCKLDDFKTFLKQRADLLETLAASFDDKSKDNNRNRNYDKPKNRSDGTRGLLSNTGSDENTESPNNSKAKYSCFYCKQGHSLFYCPDFLKLSISDRISKVKQLNLCSNCLRHNHQPKDCRWSGCKLCHLKHNTILHERKENNSRNALASVRDNSDANDSSRQNIETDTTQCALSTSQNAILSTAKVQVNSAQGTIVTARALLDCGSQSSFITSALCKKLNLPLIKTNLAVSGISDKISYVNHKCELKLRSINSSYEFNLSCFVLDNITNPLPNTAINPKILNIPVNIQLADPEFHIPKSIDILIGADAFWLLLNEGKITLGPQKPILQNTRLGWVVAGPFGVSNNKTVCSFSKNISVQNQLAKFWEVEEISVKGPILSAEEKLCEKHFCDTLTISPDNRYVVSVPLKDSPEKLGDSREIAIRRFESLEKKLMINDKLRQLYTDFLSEYEKLGHMTKVSQNNDNLEYYMPHHGVLRESSTSTKLRVVFNASSPTSTGTSLNDLQMNGPIIQQDLLSIILRFRTRPIVISSDIKMMYRQVLIDPNQRNLQKIVWRSDPNQPIETYQLNTVTYGTKAASFLAIRCLHELANECQERYPKIADIIRKDMYVDDLLTAVDTPAEAKFICQKISEIFLTRGFELRKWKSNNTDVINGLHTENYSDSIDFSANKEHDNKTLGLSWFCDRDVLTYKISSANSTAETKITKRIILSRIASIFDPLGLVSPCVIIAKNLLQKLWSEKLTWDQSLPSNILNTWLEYSSELDFLNQVKIPRKVTCDNPTIITLHGFADASQESYGACIYVVSESERGDRESHLLCAKSKVAPLKSLTMPRLELCAALVLSQLVTKVLNSVNIKIDNIYCWSDSTIVLCWLRTAPNLLKPFVDNRVAEIQKLTNTFEWKHVPTKDNPADLVSRGVRPSKLCECDMWWHGPEWLLQDSREWPNLYITLDDLPEKRKSAFTVSCHTAYFPFQRFSNLQKLKRSFAFILRFLENCRKPPESRILSALTFTEINDSFERLIKISQQESFPEEYAILSSKKDLPTKSHILSLNPFIDERGILRVGGRLQNSDFPYSKKHPILMSSKHHLTKLIFEDEHIKLMHAGPQALLAHIREKFWPTSGRNLARKIVRGCVRCAKFSGKNVTPIMGNLPSSRIQPSLPFTSVGVDYAGPFLLKDRRGRGCKIIKSWIALFVCFSTRAIHVELVLSLSSDEFLQAFSRFISRRGKPAEVFSDNGTNFVKANKDIQLMQHFLETNSDLIVESAANQGIKWHFIPPNSPHFGGLWEAGVKSFKFHLKRVLGNHIPVFYDFQTLLVRIEAILNSRPLVPLSSNPNDLTALSPSHFLIGRPLLTVPEPSVTHIPENRLSAYQKLQHLYEHFWTRWSREYVAELQQRSQWKKNQGSLKIGQLVLVKDNNLPPMKWRLGRVLDLVLGRDGISRVAVLKTMDGITSRAIIRLCPLPVES